MEIIFKNTYSNIKFVAEFGVISYPLNMQDEGVLIDDNVGLINVVGNGVVLVPTAPHQVELRIDHPLEPVQSVFGRTGNIVAEYSDYNADQIYKFDEKVENNVEVAQNTSRRHDRVHEWNGPDHTNLPTDFPPSPHTHAHADTTGQTPDDHHAQSHTHDGTDGSGTVEHNSLINRNALDSHDIASITDLQNALDDKAPVGDSFLKTEHIDVSAGINDQGKPIVLNSQGMIDTSMIDASTFYYVGPHDPSGGTEYPDTTGQSHGAFWVAQGITSPPYNFTGGDLAGKDIDNGDFMVWGTGGWSIMRGEMNPLLYYKLDGSQAITGPFAGGGQQIKNILNGTETTDGASVQQVNARVLRSGDTMTGNLQFIRNTQVNILDENSIVRGSVQVSANNEIVLTTHDDAGVALTQFVVNDNGEATINNHKVWHEANDGPGSGLNADMLDGYSTDKFLSNKMELSDEDLNGLMTTGLYHQTDSAQADIALNYPVELAGILVVYSDDDDSSNMCYQEYRAYAFAGSATGSKTYVRGWYSTQGWSDWITITDSRDIADFPTNAEVFLQTEFINTSTGSADQGKPIVLNSQGQIDPSMIDASTFYYVGPHDPSGGTEYPDITGESHGAFWVVQGITNPPYVFTGGDLAGLDIDNGDFMVWGTGGWSIMRGEMNPLLYYKLDGSQALTGDFAGGGFAIKNVANGTDNTDGAALGQVVRKDVTATQDIRSSLRVGNGTNYCSMAVQATDTENAPYFFLRSDGNNAAVIFYDTVYKVLRIIKYSEDDPTQILGQAYLDEHGDLVTSNDLLSGDNITAASSINVGVNANGNSAVRFYDDASGVPVIFWNNAAKEFQVDVNADEGFTLYHSGNFSAGRVFEELSSQHWVVGTDTTITLPVYDIAIESVFVDGLLLNPNTAYTMNDTGTEIQVILNVAPTVETCVNYRVRN